MEWHSAEKATLIRYKPEGFVRFRWEEDEGTGYFFEMTITIDEITNDLSLNVTDFARKETKTKTRLYWDNLIENLQKTGAA